MKIKEYFTQKLKVMIAILVGLIVVYKMLQAVEALSGHSYAILFDNDNNKQKK